MRTIVIGSQWLGVALLAFVAYAHAWVLVAAFLPFALFSPALNAVVIGYRMAITPDALQGRVNSVARFVAQLAAPLGPLAAGALLQATSARVTVGLFAAWLAAIALGTTASRSIRAAPSLAELASD